MTDKKVTKGEKVTWNHLGVDKLHRLKVVVSSPYETISNEGGKGEGKVELTMSFSDGAENDVHLITSFSLVSITGGTETPLDPGPSLVIDSIGPPPPPPKACPEDEHKPGEDHRQHKDRD